MNDETKSLRAIVTPADADKAIKKIFREFIWSRNRDRLEQIQQIVNKIGRAYEVSVPQPDGIPHRIRFQPQKGRGGSGVIIGA